MTRISRFHRLVILAALVLAVPVALAYPGLLDPAFGTAGLQRTQVAYAAYGDSTTQATGIVRQPDGKLVVVGPTVMDAFGVAPSRFAIARYLADGRLDPAFGLEGRVNAGPDNGRANGVLLDASGRIVVIGTAIVEVLGERLSRVALARFLPDGTPDASFGTGGVSIATFGQSSGAWAGTVDAAGRIVIAGFTGLSSGMVQSFLVARFDANGVPDTTFGQAGGAVVSFSAVAEFGRAVAIDSQGRIVVAGNASVFGAGVARLLANGSLDLAFGSGGKVTMSGTNSVFNAVTHDPAGRIVLAGLLGAPESRMAAVRLEEGGALDATFGTGGIAYAGFPAVFPLMSSASALHLDAGGRLLVGGESGPSTPSTFSFARFLPDGTLDASFGTGGRQTVLLVGATGSVASGVRGLAAGPGGTVHFAGYALNRFALGAIDADGKPVPAFNPGLAGAPVTTPVRFASGTAATNWLAVAVQADGRIVAAGSAEMPGAEPASLVALTRRLASGAPDPAFAGTGEFSLQPIDGRGLANALAVDASGRVVVAGVTGPPGFSRLWVLRLLANGVRDAAFGVNGEVATAFGTGDAIGRALAIDGNGRLVAGGSFFDGTTKRLALARYLDGGAPDASFGAGGRVVLAVGSSAEIRALALDGSGRILAAGRDEATGAALIARFTSAGAIDAGFGTAGIVSIPGNNARLNAIAIDALGRIVAAGATREASGRLAPLLVRVDASGQAATTAGNGAAVLPALGTTPAELRGIAIDAQGGILVAGYSAGRLLLARFDPATLTPDPAYGANAGVTVTGSQPSASGTGETPLSGNAIALAADGRVFVAGRDTDFLNSPLGLLAGYAAGSPAGTRSLRVVRAGAGTVTSNPAGIQCGDLCVADFPAGNAVTITAMPAAGWRFAGWTGDCNGTGSACEVTLDAARSATATFVEGVALPTGSRFANLATRMQVLNGEDVLIGGFIIGGGTPRTVVVRARGPSLASSGLTNLLPDPTIQLFAGQSVIGGNDNWGAAANAAALVSLGLEPPGANESAILATLAPGAYTAVVSGAASPGGTTGNGIVEIFDTEPLDGRLVNISTRGRVGTGNDVMIAGLVIQGTQPQTVVIRARGPSLLAQGVAGVVPNPQLQLFSGATQIAFNNDWGASADAAAIAATGLAPSHPLESALRVTLQPGAYTAIVTGVGGGTGVAIVEVFAQ